MEQGGSNVADEDLSASLSKERNICDTKRI